MVRDGCVSGRLAVIESHAIAYVRENIFSRRSVGIRELDGYAELTRPVRCHRNHVDAAPRQGRRR